MNHGTSVIIKNFEIETDKDSYSDEELFEILSKQIADMLEYRAEFLFSLLYRMDVKEAKVEAVMHPAAAEPPHIGLTRLVISRQAERNLTRKIYKQDKIEGLDEELEY